MLHSRQLDLRAEESRVTSRLGANGKSVGCASANFGGVQLKNSPTPYKSTQNPDKYILFSFLGKGEKVKVCVGTASPAPLTPALVTRHAKPPLCGEVSGKPRALSWDRTRAIDVLAHDITTIVLHL